MYSIPAGVGWYQAEADGLLYEWLIPEKKVTETVLFYIHGGGFVLPLYNPSRYVMGSLARQTGMRVLCAGYRLAPEFPYPGGLEDCLRLYRLLVREGILDPKKTIFIGESAGANLAIASLLALRDSGEALPVAVVTISPAL